MMKPPFGSKPRAVWLWIASLLVLGLLPCIVVQYHLLPWTEFNELRYFTLALGGLAALVCLWQSIQLLRHAFSVPKGVPLKISAVLLCVVLCAGIGVSAYDLFSFAPGAFRRAVVLEKGPDYVVMQEMSEPFPPVRLRCTLAEYYLLEEGGTYGFTTYTTRKLTGESYLTSVYLPPEAARPE